MISLQQSYKEEQHTQNIMDQCSCKRCGYTTDYNHSLLRHLRRQKECPPSLSDVQRDILISELTDKTYNDVTYDCTHCGMKFNSRSNKSRHTNHSCKKRPQPVVTDLQPDIQNQHTTTHTTIITNNNTNNGVINNIHVHTFGKEDISYLLEHPNIEKLLLRCFKTKSEGLLDIIRRKHFDPLHPENHTVKKMNKKDPFIEVFKNGSWVLKDKDDALEDIFLGVQAIFGDFIQRSSDDIDKLKTILDEFMKKIGEPLGWELNCDVYTYMDTLSHKDKELYKKRLFQLGCEYIYRRSQHIFESS